MRAIALPRVPPPSRGAAVLAAGWTHTARQSRALQHHFSLAAPTLKSGFEEVEHLGSTLRIPPILFLDIAIGAVLLIALVVGYQKGVIQPLLVEIFFLAAILVIITNAEAYSAAMSRYLHAPGLLQVFLALIVAVVAGYIGGVAGAAIHRMPVVRGVDGLLGMFIHVGVATIVIYLLLSALVQVDKAFTAARSATLTLAQVNTLQSQLRGNPLTAAIVNAGLKDDLAKLRKEAQTPSGARLADAAGLSFLKTGVDFVEPQLHQSRLAPYVLLVGSKVPVIGHTRPEDLKALATPTPSPSGSPKPTPSPTKKP